MPQEGHLMPGSFQADGHVIAQEIARKCNMGFNTSYSHISQIKQYQQSAQYDPESELNKAFPGMPDGKFKDEMKIRLQSEAGSERWAISRRWPNENYQAPLMGGNFMGLPGGVLAVGESKVRPVDSEVLKFFEKSQKIAKIKIPALGVGHIDEVFKIIPSKNSCGYALVRASPISAKSFLRSRPPTEKFGDISGLKDTVLNVLDSKTKQHKLHQDLLKTSSPEAEEKFLKSTRRNLTTSEIINDKELMSYWDKLQTDIDQGTVELIREINKSRGTSCKPEILDLPTFFTMDGTPAIANPVNGIYVNGKYFKSQSKKNITTKNKQDKLDTESYSQLDQFIDKKLKSHIPGGIIEIDTGGYDKGNGNLHCATMNIYAPCID